MLIDTHAHAFRLDVALAAERRYSPPRNKPVEEYLDILDRHGIACGVLVQPSFLGTNNNYLIACLDRLPRRLRGVAVVDPDPSDDLLGDLAKRGVVGLRLNVIETLGPWTSHTTVQDLGRKAARHRMHVELHARGTVLADLIAQLLPTGASLVIDHFGRPHGPDDLGFRSILEAGASGRVWVKLSGPYRVPAPSLADLAATLLRTLGPDRLVWGSDWPWTQNETGRSYADLLTQLEEWVQDSAARGAILGSSAKCLFRFDTA